jgi:F-type H+-transporting ATPase subunit gamma
MYKYGLALVCLACAVDARRVQHNVVGETSDEVTAKNLLASMLFVAKPAIRSSTPVARAAALKMGGRGDIKVMRERITGLKGAEAATYAMKNAAAAKARKAADRASQSKPFISTLRNSVSKLTERINLEGGAADIPLLEIRPVKKVALVVISADRGLCGAYNTKIIRKMDARIEELKKLGLDYEIFSIGRTNFGHMQRNLDRYPNIAFDTPCTPQPTAEQSQMISKAVVDRFLEGEIDRAELIYTSFTSMVSSKPSIRTLIPFTVSGDGIEMEDDEIFRVTSQDGELAVERTSSEEEGSMLQGETVLEQAPEVLVNTMLPLYLNGGILSALQNAVASELGARFQAMQAATDNCKDLIARTQIAMNKQRQAQITKEICEIIAGSSEGDE